MTFIYDPKAPAASRARGWPAEIASEAQAYAWFLSLMINDRLNFHPDDSAEAYVNAAGSATFGADEVEEFDNLMAACFGVCDPYEVGVRAQEAFRGAQVFRGKHATPATGITAWVSLERNEGPYVVAENLDADTADELALTLNRAILTAILKQAQEVARG